MWQPTEVLAKGTCAVSVEALLEGEALPVLKAITRFAARGSPPM